jgi:hypothetical protein
MTASTIRASILAASILALTSGCTGHSPAPIAATPAPAERKMLSVDSPLGEIFDTPTALAVLQAQVPELAGDPATKKNIRLYSLRTISGSLPSMNPQKLAELDARLRQYAAPLPDMNGPAGDPSFRSANLELTGFPKGVGAPIALFNGSDLSGWDVFLGPAERVNGTYPAIGKAVGLNNDTTPIFSVQQVDGAAAIRVDGRIWGTLTTKAEHANYHLHLEYKWGDVRWPKDKPDWRNNGILYHSYGPFGAADQTWMDSIELEMIPGQVAGVNPVGLNSHFRTVVGRDVTIDSTSKRRFMLGGRDVAIGTEGYEFVQGTRDTERPIGQWNTIDLYVFGDRAIHVLNGVPVLEIRAMTGGKDHLPLTRGKIQLQSEGAETFFRNVTLRQIEKLPRIQIKR